MTSGLRFEFLPSLSLTRLHTLTPAGTIAIQVTHVPTVLICSVWIRHPRTQNSVCRRGARFLVICYRRHLVKALTGRELICSSMTDGTGNIRVLLVEFKLSTNSKLGKYSITRKKTPERLEAESCIRWEGVYVKYLRKCKCYIPPLLVICHGIYIYIYVFIYIYLSIYTETHLSAVHTSVSTSGAAPLSDSCLGVTLSWMFCGCFYTSI